MNVRLIEEAEVDQLYGVMSQAFGFETKPEHLENLLKETELDRTFAAFEGNQLIGTGGAYSLELTVPGGLVACGGTTIISVLPTHRRRGALTEMMRFHLDEVASRREPLAALWASEAPIYGRFGYGEATEAMAMKFNRNDVSFVRPPLGTGSIRILEHEEAAELLPALYDRIRPTRPGFMSRTEGRWAAAHFYDPSEWRDGGSPRRWIVYEEDGPAQGFASYRQRESWADGIAAHRVSYEGLVAVNPAAEDGLWRYLCGLDLTEKLDGWNSDPNALLPRLVADARRVKRTTTDGMWVRILDVPAALQARRYRVDGRLVLEVHDPFRGSAAGTFLLEAHAGTATCAPTSEPADLRLDVRELSSAYLGGTTFFDLARAGLVSGSEEALERADLLFGWHIRPWCPEVF